MLDVWDHTQAMWQQLWQGDVQAILFWVAVYFGLVGAYSLFFQMRIRRWPATPGVLAQAGLKRTGGPEWRKSDQQYRLRSIYHYRVDGHAYEGHRVSSWVMSTNFNGRFLLEAQLKGVKRLPDGTVTVFYDPKRPHKSFLIQPGLLGLLITWVIALGPAFYYWSRFHAV